MNFSEALIALRQGKVLTRKGLRRHGEYSSDVKYIYMKGNDIVDEHGCGYFDFDADYNSLGFDDSYIEDILAENWKVIDILLDGKDYRWAKKHTMKGGVCRVHWWPKGRYIKRNEGKCLVWQDGKGYNASAADVDSDQWEEVKE